MVSVFSWHLKKEFKNPINIKKETYILKSISSNFKLGIFAIIYFLFGVHKKNEIINES